ncbi:SagB/ThcOx family dehydrogenase [Microbispora sp. CA-135349]|uniref:SagB/ThcOx family dehydrogenase n=1 Tax=Microbispora sp. CA-135349 TaxID=3239953 RepID=UPI003D944802
MSPFEAGMFSGPWRSLLSLREDVHVEETADGDLVLHGRWGDVLLRQPDPIVRGVLNRMSLGPISLSNAVSGHGGGAHGVAAVLRVLDRIEPLVVRTVGRSDGRLLVSVAPIAPAARLRPEPLPADRPIRLSRFAMVRTDGSGYILESPLSLHRATLHHPGAVRMIGMLARATTTAEALGDPPDDRLLVDALVLLTAAGLVVRGEHAAAPAEKAMFAEDTDPALAAWSPLDLMFHTRSTLGRHDHDFGATYPLGTGRSPEPVVRPAADGPVISLDRPAWEEILGVDPPLSVAVEGRRTARRYTGEPVSLRELGELLYRTARVRSLVLRQDGEEPSASSRPYPSGGSSYELEIYMTTTGGRDLPGGVYHYDPLGHRLEVVSTDPAIVAELLENARTAADASGTAAVLLTMTARFRRVSWKYRGPAYALMLKNLGALTQTLYLVATAMGLSASPLGAGDVDTSARALGVDWRVESSLGELLIGRPETSSGDTGRLPVNDAAWAERAAAYLGVKRGG